MAALLVRRSLQFKLRSSFNNVVSNATRETFTSANRMEKIRRKEIKIHSPALFFFFPSGRPFQRTQEQKKGAKKLWLNFSTNDFAILASRMENFFLGLGFSTAMHGKLRFSHLMVHSADNYYYIYNGVFLLIIKNSIKGLPCYHRISCT